MTAATYRLTTNIEFLVIPPMEDLSRDGKQALDTMQRETPNYARTPAGETLFSRAVFDMHAANMNWDPESLEYELMTRSEFRTVVVPVQL